MSKPETTPTFTLFLPTGAPAGAIPICVKVPVAMLIAANEDKR